MIRRMAALAFVAGITVAGAAPNPTASPVPASAPLEGTVWSLLDLVAASAQPAAPEGPSPRILLQRKGAKKQLSGSTGCTSLRGTYDLFAGRLRFAPATPKKVDCPESLLLQEKALLTALQQTADFRIAKDELTLLSADGRVLVRFRQVR
jgi:heat shock protein HslJ